MEPKKLYHDDSLVPFWGKSHTLVKGLDQLGMQNTSIATYSVLLPGLTNLTNRIRYYGFYCWLLNFYANEIRIPDVTTFRLFIRHSELFIAYLMALSKPMETGIPGSLYVSRHLEKLSTEADTVIDLNKGAHLDKNKERYWQYASGAFGQYYAGVLLQLGLIKHQSDDERIYICTADRGEELAYYFAENLKKGQDYTDIKNLFLQNISQGNLTRAIILEYAPYFNLSSIPDPSAELDFYRDLLLGPDSVDYQIKPFSRFRSESIANYLHLLKTNTNLEKPFHGQFPHLVYSIQKLQNEKIATSYYGWFFYQLNEFAHYAMETLLWGVLQILREESRPIQISSLLEKIGQMIIPALESDLNLHTNEPNVDDILACIEKSPFDEKLISDNIEKMVKNTSLIPAMVSSIELIFRLFVQNAVYLKDIQQFAQVHDMGRDGNVTDILLYIEQRQNAPLGKFISDFFLRSVIDRHIFVALRKFRTTRMNTLKFNISNNYYSFREISEPVWTSPRLQNLDQFLCDLRFINRERRLLSYGITYLNQCGFHE